MKRQAIGILRAEALINSLATQAFPHRFVGLAWENGITLFLRNEPTLNFPFVHNPFTGDAINDPIWDAIDSLRTEILLADVAVNMDDLPPEMPPHGVIAGSRLSPDEQEAIERSLHQYLYQCAKCSTLITYAVCEVYGIRVVLAECPNCRHIHRSRAFNDQV